jgi:hypothetical protein
MSIDGQAVALTEQHTLDQWLTASPHNRTVYDEVMNPNTLERDMKQMVGVDKAALYARIKQGIGDTPTSGFLSFFNSRISR